MFDYSPNEDFKVIRHTNMFSKVGDQSTNS